MAAVLNLLASVLVSSQGGIQGIIVDASSAVHAHLAQQRSQDNTVDSTCGEGSTKRVRESTMQAGG